MNRQLALAIQLNEEATLSEFCWGNNSILHQQIDIMLQGQGEHLIYLWGTPGCGKSHLLQACCHALTQQAVIYLPLLSLKQWGPQVLEGIEQQTFIAIDDLDSIAGDKIWEEALFHLYNRIRDQGETRLLMASRASPAQSPICLADLRSRLSWGLVVELHELSDEEKITTLKLHALKRGFDLPTSVGQFLLSRCTRNMHDLNQLLQKLDDASLQAQRRITIPFVKAILNL